MAPEITYNEFCVLLEHTITCAKLSHGLPWFESQQQRLSVLKGLSDGFRALGQLELTMDHPDGTTRKVPSDMAVQYTDRMRKTCRCGSVSNTHCSGCKIRYYCSAICQSADWPTHKSECGKKQ